MTDREREKEANFVRRYGTGVTSTWEELAARGRQLAIEQGINPDELRTVEPEAVSAAFLAEHSPSLLTVGDEVIITWVWDQEGDDVPTL